MLLTQSQVSIVFSAITIFFFTLALFLSGYVLQQKTLTNLRAAIRPSTLTGPSDLHFYTPGSHDAPSPLPNLSPRDTSTIEISPTPQTNYLAFLSSLLPSSGVPTPPRRSGGIVSTANKMIHRWIARVRGEEAEEEEEEDDLSIPIEQLSRAARRRRIKAQIRTEGDGEDVDFILLFNMKLFQTIVTALTVITGVLAILFDSPGEKDGRNPAALPSKRSVPPTSQGYHNGYFYAFWSDGIGNITYTLSDSTSSYSVAWEDISSFYGGIGWNPGSGRTINYSGTFNPTGNAYLSIYGFTLNPLVEYYVVESFGTYDPGNAGTYKGTFTSDGGTYKVYFATRVSNISGEPVLRRYWSVRQEKRSVGSVNMQNHFNAWKGFGMEVGEHDFQIVATEGYQSAGEAEVFVDIDTAVE
ncbi:hypothetical protein V494_04932 [Pseudogymnoascus sp. VKM F-4513 (FW-928)]|nr:hypothetical protein V494_04932 [Pseudogymnoascus sp. VKM F-4513 (FW-928)]